MMNLPSRLAVLAFSVATLGAGAASAQPLDIGFVYQSPVSDVGWVAVHETARKQLEKEFGNRISTRVVQDVKAGPDGARIMRELVGSGAGMVVLGSFGYMNDGLKPQDDLRARQRLQAGAELRHLQRALV